jgi:hypothetical protein
MDPWKVMVMRMPDGADGPGGDGGPGDVPFRHAAGQGWRGWVRDVAMVVRRRWRAIAAVLLITTVLPTLPLSGLIADGVAAGSASSPNGKGSPGLVAAAVLIAPVLLALAVGCALVVAQGWTNAVWAAASAGSGRPIGVLEASSWSRRRSRLLAGTYLAGAAVLTSLAFLAGYAAPSAPTVPDLLVLAGPAGLLAPVLCFVPAAAWRRRAPRAGELPDAEGAPAGTRAPAFLVPLAFVLAAVVGYEITAALALSVLLTSASGSGADLEGINGPAAAVIASLVALPGSVLLAAASSVSYTRYWTAWRR